MNLPNMPTPFVRPKTLIRAARINLKSYVRDRNLSAILNMSNIPPDGTAHSQLGQKEAELNSARKSGALSYRIQDHIAVMTALLAEYALSNRIQDG